MVVSPTASPAPLPGTDSRQPTVLPSALAPSGQIGHHWESIPTNSQATVWWTPSSSSSSSDPTNTIRPTFPPTVDPAERKNRTSLSPTEDIVVTVEPTGGPVASPTRNDEDDEPDAVGGTFTFDPKRITVGAYYYPWYGDDFHRGTGYVRRYLKHEPELGEYDDRDPKVIAQHLEWSKQANIKLWVASWWGPNRREDDTIKDIVMKHPKFKEQNHQIALFYESTHRVMGGRGQTPSKKNVAPDMRYICENYFDHPNYFKINGRPVLVVYITRSLAARDKMLMLETFLTMRSTAADYGHNVFLVGDHAFGRPPSQQRSRFEYGLFDYLDAVTNYDAYGTIKGDGAYATQGRVDRYADHQRGWKREAALQGCAYIPGVTPGYNDRGIRLEADHMPLSRQLDRDSEHGSLFEEILRGTRGLVDDAAYNLLLVNSFNEWHEDTQIEPVVGRTRRGPREYTQGVEYIGYGDLYLNILKRMTDITVETSTTPSLSQKKLANFKTTTTTTMTTLDLGSQSNVETVVAETTTTTTSGVPMGST